MHILSIEKVSGFHLDRLLIGHGHDCLLVTNRICTPDSYGNDFHSGCWCFFVPKYYRYIYMLSSLQLHLLWGISYILILIIWVMSSC